MADNAALIFSDGFAATSRRGGLTLVDTLFVVIISFVVSLFVVIVLPKVVPKPRSVPRAIACIDNLRQLAIAAHGYAQDHDGSFFAERWVPVPAMGPKGEDPRVLWSDDLRLGPYIEGRAEWVPWASDRKQAINGILRCPEARPEEARSYAQSHWANGLGGLSKTTLGDGRSQLLDQLGEHFDARTEPADKLMLLLEANAMEPLVSSEGVTGWVTGGRLGASGRPSARLSGGPNGPPKAPRVSSEGPGFGQRRYGSWRLTWDPNYSHHGITHGPLAPIGETTIAFADGHVERLRHDALYDPATGQSTYRALWSARDRYFDEVGGHISTAPAPY